MKGCIFNIQRYSLHDGGGIRSIVFFKGCPFHCPWCSNPESLKREPQVIYRNALCINCSKKQNGVCNSSVDDCPTNALEIAGEYKTVDEVFEIIKRDIPFYETSGGGITLSGGECLWQEAFAIKLLQRCKVENIHTAIETSLALPIKQIKDLVDNTDVFLVDFKIMNETYSKKTTGIQVDHFKKNIDAILALKGNIIARIPLIPEFTTSKENLEDIMCYLKEKKLKEVHLLPFHKLGEAKYDSIQMDYKLHDLQTLSEQEVSYIENLFQQNGFHTVVGGN